MQDRVSWEELHLPDTIHLSFEAWKAFRRALSKPPEPTLALEQLFADHLLVTNQADDL